MIRRDALPPDPLAAARRLFLEQGYQATSMEQVATAMGVVKQTLYNRFENKEALFTRVVEEAAESFLVTLRTSRGELHQDLLQFARVFRGVLLSPEGLAFYRLLMGEASRFPGLARAVFQAGPLRTRRELAQFLELAMTEGRMASHDPQFAADMLLSMLTGLDRTRFLLGEAFPSPQEEEERIGLIVESFLRAFPPTLPNPV